MGCGWYSFSCFVGKGIMVPMMSIILASKRDLPAPDSVMNKDTMIDRPHQRAIYKWILDHLPAAASRWSVHFIANRFVFIGCGEKLQVMSKLGEIPGPHEIDYCPFKLKLMETCDVESHVKLVQAARAIIPSDHQLAFSPGKWLVSVSEGYSVTEMDDTKQDYIDQFMDQFGSDSDNKNLNSASEGLLKRATERKTWEEESIILPAHPALTNPRFFDISFRVGTAATLVQSNRAYLACHSQFFSEMFFGDWKKLAQDEAIIYTDFEVHAFRIVLAFIIGKTEERQAIVAALSEFQVAHLQEIIKVAGFFNEAVLEAICLDMVHQTHDTMKGLVVHYSPMGGDDWDCHFEDE